jgi:translation initiation factor 2B subunit (eIF-2B alpha/beta/delta family)
MPRIRELLATTDETMASVEGMTRVAREQVEEWSPLVTDARHVAEGMRDQATHVVQQVESSARHLEASLVRPLSREWRIWGHGLSVFGQHMLRTARTGRTPPPPGGEGDA